MARGKLAVLAQLALAANAVLIPYPMGDDAALETLAIDPSKRSVSLECPGCAVAVLGEDEKLRWEEDEGNTFVLEFETGPSEDSLYIDNDFQLYPPSFAYFSKPFKIVQLAPSGKDNLSLRVTGYRFHFSGAETISEAGMELLPMTFEITAIEGQHMSPPALTINILKDAEGRLMIASFEPAQISEAEPATPEEESCNEWPLLCKWKQSMAERIEKMKKMGKGCHKRPHGTPVNPMEKETLEGKPPHRFRPGRPHHRPHHRPHYMKHEGHHHGPHGHHEHHRFHMFLRRAFFTILVPVLIGIFAGTLTYLVGMALGCLIAMAIARVRGQEYQRIALAEDEEEAVVVVERAEGEDEKEGYAELPAYDAPPVYEEEVNREDGGKEE